MKSRRLRVLQVVQSLDIGGVERLQVTLARFHDRSRLELRICSYRGIDDGPIACELQSAGVPLFSLGGPRLHDPRALTRLVRLVREQRIHVLHSHLSTPNILAAAASALTSRPAISTLHNLTSLDESRSRGNRCLEAQALRRRMRLVLAVAPEIARDAERWLHLDPRRVAVMPNGIDLSAFDDLDSARVRACRRELLGGRAGPLIVSVGSLAPRKDHALLVDAVPRLLERFPEARVAIVGRPASAAAELRMRIGAAGLERQVACVGERRDIADVLGAADLFVLPSALEGLPLSLLEAMAARTPVVVTGAGGVTSVVQDQITGRLVAPGDADALARAMVESLASPDRSRRLADRGRDLIEARHGANAWAARLTERYGEVVARAASSV